MLDYLPATCVCNYQVANYRPVHDPSNLLCEVQETLIIRHEIIVIPVFAIIT